MTNRSTLILAGITLLVSSPLPLRAELVITFSQNGPNVVASGSGSVDVTDLSSLGVTGALQGSVDPSGFLEIGGLEPNGVVSYVLYGPISEPSSFGAPNNAVASSGSGDDLGFATSQFFFPEEPKLLLPLGYTSGAQLNGSSTWDNTTIAGLGLTPGTYTSTWGTGNNADSLEVVIPASVPPPTPEPSSLILAGTGFLALGGFGLHRRRRRPHLPRSLSNLVV